jgi:hypothetical protein
MRGTRTRFTGTVGNVAGAALPWRNSYSNAGSYSFEFTWRADGQRHWIRVAARDGAGHLAPLGNPIYLAAPPCDSVVIETLTIFLSGPNNAPASLATSFPCVRVKVSGVGAWCEKLATRNSGQLLGRVELCLGH